MKWIHTFAETMRQLSTATQTLMIFCGSYMLAILFFAAAVRFGAGGLVGYYTARVLAGELLECVRPCVGITALGSLLTEGLRTA